MQYLKTKLSNDGNLKELLSGSSKALIIRLFAVGFGYFFYLLVSHKFGAKVLGIFVLTQTIMIVFSIFGRLGTDTYLLRFISSAVAKKTKEQILPTFKKIVWLVFFVSSIFSIMFFLLTPFIAVNIFQKPELELSLKIGAFCILPFTLVFINSESLRGLKEITLFSIFRNTSLPTLSGFIIIIFLIWFNNTLLPILAYCSSIIIFSIMSYFILRRRLYKFKVKQFIPNNYRGILKQSIPMMLTSSMFLIMQWTDTIMLGIYSTSETVGVYNIAIKLSFITSISLFAINSISAPKFSELFVKEDIQGLKKVVQQSTTLIFWTTAPILIIYLTFPSFSMGLFGKEFISGKNALIFLSIGQFVNAISGSVGYFLQMTGNQNIFRNIIGISSLLNIILNIILIPQYGINGAAIASMVSMMVWNISSIVYIYKKFGILTMYYPIITSVK